MYFLDIDKLKEEIKTECLTERSRFLYAMIYIVLTTVIIEYGYLSAPQKVNLSNILGHTINIIIVFVGTYAAYQANGAENGKDFLGKYFSIGFVVGIRFTICSILLLIIPYYYYNSLKTSGNILIETIPFLAWSVLMYWRIYIHIEQVK